MRKIIEKWWAITYLENNGKESIVGFRQALIFTTRRKALEEFLANEYTKKDDREEMKGGWRIRKIEIHLPIKRKIK